METRGKSHGFSVFIDNLPYNLDNFGLKGIFRKVGWVKDAYSPAKQGKTVRRYGFVRFWRKDDARTSIRLLNGRRIRGAEIRVRMARFGKGGLQHKAYRVFKQPWMSSSQQRSRRVWRRKDSQDYKILSNQKVKDPIRSVKGEVNVSFLDWLCRSLLCVSNEPSDMEMLSKYLVKDDCSKLYALSKFKFILTFATMDHLEATLANNEELDKWFYEVKKWDIYEVCDTRRVWIDVFGVPPHGWSQQNFENIVAFWGKMVCLETTIEDTLSFESMRILIDSDIMQTNEGHLILQLGDAGYRVEVKEASCSIQINPQFIVSVRFSSMEVKVQNDDHQNVKGYGVDVAQQDDMDSCHWPKANRVEVDTSVGVARGSPNPVLEEGGGQHLQLNSKSPNGSSNSSFTTKTAQFSQNAVSEEVFKLSQKAAEQPFIEKNGNMINWSDAQFKCLGTDAPPRIPSPKSKLNEQLDPPGFDSHNVEESDEITIPPGFELSQPVLQLGESSHIIQSKAQKRQHEGLDKRLTRSQARKVLRSIEDSLSSSRQNKKGSDGFPIPLGFELSQPIIQPGDYSHSLKSKAQISHHEEVGKRTSRCLSRKVKGPIVRNRKKLNRVSSVKGRKEGSPQSNKSSETTESMNKLALESSHLGEIFGLKVIDKKEVALKRITSGLKKERKAKATHSTK